MEKNELMQALEQVKASSYWKRGVIGYALELAENLGEDEIINQKNARSILLNGASNWSEYSWGGCSCIYDQDIALRLCTPSELKQTKNGQRQPNKQEQWLDVQARALTQAYYLILNTIQ